MNISQQFVTYVMFTIPVIMGLGTFAWVIISIKSKQASENLLKKVIYDKFESNAYLIIIQSSPSIRPGDCIKIVEIFNKYSEIFYNYYKINKESINDTFVEDISNFLRDEKLGVDCKWVTEVIYKYCLVLYAEKQKVEFQYKHFNNK